MARIPAEEFRRRAVSRMDHRTNENFAGVTLNEMHEQLVMKLRACSDPEVSETLKKDLRLVEAMNDQDRSLFQMLCEPGDVFFQSNDNQLCFFNCLSEANYAAQNFEGRLQRPLEICQGICETLGASSPLNSAEKLHQICSALEVLSNPTNYLAFDEIVHHGAAVHLNMEITVATGTYLDTKTPRDSASYLGLTPPIFPSMGAAKLMLRCPRNSEEHGVTRHYNAVLSQARVASSSSGIKRRSLNQFEMLRDDDDEESDSAVSVDLPHKNPRSEDGLFGDVSEAAGGERGREAVPHMNVEPHDLDVVVRYVDASEAPHIPNEAPDPDFQLHDSGAQYSEAPDMDAEAPLADVEVNDADAQYHDAEEPHHHQEPRCEQEIQEDKREPRLSEYGGHLTVEEIHGNTHLKSSLISTFGVARGFIGVTVAQSIDNLTSVLGPVSTQLQHLFARGRAGRIADSEAITLKVQRELEPRIAALQAFSSGTGRSTGLLCLAIFFPAINVTLVYEETPGAVAEYMRNAGNSSLCIGLHSPPFDFKHDVLKINSSRNNWTRQESQIRTNFLKSLSACCALGQTQCGIVTDDWKTDDLSHFVGEKRTIADESGRRMLTATTGVSDYLLPAATSSLQAALQSRGGNLGLSAILLALAQNGQRHCLILPILGTNGFKMLGASVRAVVHTHGDRGGADPSYMACHFAGELLARLGLAPPSPSMQRSTAKSPSSQLPRQQPPSEAANWEPDEPTGYTGESEELSFDSGFPYSGTTEGAPAGPQMSPSFEHFLRTAASRIVKVFESHRPDGITVHTFAMPPYSPDGCCNFAPHVLVDVTDGEGRCQCSMNSFASYLPSGSTATQGAENGICHHERVFAFSPELRDKFLGLACSTVQMRADSSRFFLLDQSVHQPRVLHVCIVCSGEQYRHPIAVLTITPGHVSCLSCHNGAKKHVDDPGHCPHAQCLKSLVDDAALTTAGIDVIRLLVRSERGDTPGDLTYDTAQNCYRSDSLDEKIDSALDKLGLPIPVVPRRMRDVNPSCCRLSPQTQGDIPVGADGVLEMAPPPPAFLPPLHASCGCVYGEDFIKPETDEGGRTHEGRAYFLSSSSKVRVYSRNCSSYHPQCCIPFSGSTFGFHRQTHTTMVRYEIPLLLWENNKNMKGPGTTAFVSMLETLYTLAGSESRPEIHDTVKLSLQDTAMRRCFISFHVRQRRNFKSRKCPVCPGGECTTIVADAKRMGIPVRLYNGTSPHIVGPNSEVRQVRGSIMQRLFWPTDANKRARSIMIQLADAILKDAQGTGKLSQIDLRDLPSIAPEKYRLAVVYLLNHFWATGGVCSDEPEEAGEVAHEVADDDSFVDDDDSSSSDDRAETAPVAPDLERTNDIDGTYVLYYNQQTLGLTIRADGIVSNFPVVDKIEHPYRNGPCVGDQLLGVVDAEVSGGSSGDVTHDNSNKMLKLLSDLIRASPRPIRLRFRAAGTTSRIVARALAVQFKWICNKQCEPTQWITASDSSLLKDILNLHDSEGFGTVLLQRWKTSNLRRSLFNVVESSKYFDHSSGLYKLSEVAASLLRAMVVHTDSLRAVAAAAPPRSIIPEEQRPKYDPTTGTAINFTPSGQQLSYWPDFKLARSAKQSEHNCGCGKPSWDEGPGRGLTNGILTGLCGRSGFHLLTVFLPDHEGCKHLASALYTHHPDPRKLQFVMTDTPCKHSTYLITRAPHDFTDVVIRGDTFHITPHTCSQIYSPSEYRSLDHTNTSMIEQWHAVMDCLSKITAGSTLAHAMFILQLLHDDRYYEICEKFGVSEASW